MISGVAPGETAIKGYPPGQVAILLTTFNGEKYLAEQLDSIAAQSHRDWIIVASDDGSSDATLTILEQYQQRFGSARLSIRRGPCRGFAANFVSLACDKSITADYYAFSDQDDIWHADKLTRAVTWLDQMPREKSALYCARTRLVDEAGKPMGLSPLFRRTPCFANALVQSIAGGNTMVFNAATRRLLTDVGFLPIVSHDWWTYILTTGNGGTVKYDAIPSIDYRQHASNLIGSNSTVRDRIYRLQRMFAGHFRNWNSTHLRSLSTNQHLFTDESNWVMTQFAKARNAPLLPRLIGTVRSGVHRQTLFGNMGLFAATLLGKL